jgi:hypothetical protein
MKRTFILIRYLLTLILSVFLSASLLAGNITLGESGDNTLKVTENTYSILSLNNELANIEFVRVKTNAGYFTLFHIPEYGYSMVEGSPKLPVIKKLIELPLDATVDVEIISQQLQELGLSDYFISDPVMPAQPPLSKNIDNPEDVEFILNEERYQTDEFWGPEVVTVVELGMIRGVRMARLEIAPVRYNPVQNTIQVITDLKLKIAFSGANVGATLAEREDGFSPYFEGIYKQFINYKPLEGKEFITDEPVTYIIVSDPDFEDALAPFVEWKTKKGFIVVEAYTDNPAVGNTTTSIKSYLHSFYEDPPESMNPQSFVLFVGDVAQIPAFNGTAGGHVSDLYYCTYDGPGDIFPECYYGRFSANNLTELQPQIDKTLEYEQYLFADPSFLDEVVMVAGADATHATTWGNGQINYGTTYYFNAAHGLTSHTYLQPEPGGANYAQNIREDINNGVAYANYTAHCSPSGWADPSFNIGHVPQLTNEGKYPLMIGNCCSSVEFQTTCFGEVVLRAENKGALGYIGGSNSTYWDEDFWWGVGFESISANPIYDPDHLGAYDRLFHDNGEPLEEWYVTQGQMPAAGNLAVTQSGSIKEIYYWEIYHLMGDPSLMVYFSQPPETTPNYQGLMPLGASTFSVTTEPYTYVAISKDGVLHGCGIADESGLAEVNMFNPIVVPGEADIVITGQNFKPFIGTVNVASPEGAYVLLDEISLDDSDGNNNGLADFGEYVMVNVTLENLGQQLASNLSATLTTSDDMVTIETGSHDWPDIGSGNTSTEDQAFAFTVEELIPDQHEVPFDLEVTDGTDTWNSTFQVVLNAPVLMIGSYTIDDASGNGNGRLDPGETADIIIPNINDGGSDALNSVASLVCGNPLFSLLNTSVTLGTIASGESKDAVFTVTVDPSIAVGEVITADYALESAPYMINSMLSFTIGLIVEDFETGTFAAYPWEFGGDGPWVIDASAYEGEYAAKSGTIGDNSTTALLVTLEVSNDDQISFFYRVSSENNYDYLRFYVDDIMLDEWSGDVPWSEASYDVTAGMHTFKWEYAKDYSVSSGSDCAWVDFIVFPSLAGAAPLAVIASASPEELCNGESTQLFAYAIGGSGNYTYEWMPEGSLDDPTIANPTATPEATTTYYVVVSDGDGTVTGETEVVVHPLPEQPVITQSGTDLVSSAENGNQWYNTEGMIPGATGQAFTPTATDDYYVIVTSADGCISEPSESYYFIYTGLIEMDEGQSVAVYPNPFSEAFTLDYSLKTPSAVHITLFNTFGQVLTVLEESGDKPSGNHRIRFNAGEYEAGIYFLKIETNEYAIIKRIIHSTK